MLRDGPHGIPIVYHGRTLTKPVTAHDVFSTIARYAFVASPYPLILSLESHLSPVQQIRLVESLRATLGDMMLDTRLPGFEEKLPSPEALKYRILIKTKNRDRRLNSGVIDVGSSTTPLRSSSLTTSINASDSDSSSDSGEETNVLTGSALVDEPAGDIPLPLEPLTSAAQVSIKDATPQRSNLASASMLSSSKNTLSTQTRTKSLSYSESMSDARPHSKLRRTCDRNLSRKKVARTGDVSRIIGLASLY